MNSILRLFGRSALVCVFAHSQAIGRFAIRIWLLLVIFVWTIKDLHRKKGEETKGATHRQ